MCSLFFSPRHSKSTRCPHISACPTQCSRFKLAQYSARSSTNLKGSFSPGNVSQHRPVFIFTSNRRGCFVPSIPVLYIFPVSISFRLHIPSFFVGFFRFFHRRSVTLLFRELFVTSRPVSFEHTQLKTASHCCCRMRYHVCMSTVRV